MEGSGSSYRKQGGPGTLIYGDRGRGRGRDQGIYLSHGGGHGSSAGRTHGTQVRSGPRARDRGMRTSTVLCTPGGILVTKWIPRGGGACAR